MAIVPFGFLARLLLAGAIGVTRREHAFEAAVEKRAVGAEVSKALNPGQQIIKIVNEELIFTLGEPAPLNLTGAKPRVIMMVGLQGSGKTTGAGKLARLLRSKGERVMLVAPLLMAAVVVPVALAVGVGLALARQDASPLVPFLAAGVLGAFVAVPLGYAYVGLVVVLRRLLGKSAVATDR